MAKLERKSMPKEEKVNNTSHFLPIACMVSDSLLCWIISRDSNETFFFFLHDSKITKIKPSIKKLKRKMLNSVYSVISRISPKTN